MSRLKRRAAKCPGNDFRLQGYRSERRGRELIDSVLESLSGTLPRDRLERLQIERFRRITQWAFDNSRFHRALYEKAGVVPSDTSSTDGVQRGPISGEIHDAPDPKQGPEEVGSGTMIDETKIAELRRKVKSLQDLVSDINSMADDFPAVNRNIKRIQASIEMLRINLEDA